ncbi:MAG: response regulator [Alphaproteobacteria bacterium]
MGQEIEAIGKHLLIVDDDIDLCDVMREIAAAEGYEVIVAYEGNVFKELYTRYRPGRIILDLAIPDIDGLELLNFLAGEHCDAMIIIASSHRKTIIDQAVKLGTLNGLRMVTALQKPFSSAELKSSLA